MTAWPYAPAGPIQPPYRGYPKTPGAATAALVLGIVSLPACCCWPVGLVCGILAIVFGGWVARDIAAGLIEPAAESKAKAGRTCGIIGVVLAILMLILGIINLIASGGRMHFGNLRF
jgi:hypothetical protein